MPFVKSLASKCCTYIVSVIFLLGEIMPICSRCAEKKLVYIAIIVLFSRQPSSCVKCTKLNIHLSYNIRSVSDAKYL